VDRLRAIVLTHGDVAHVEGYARLVHEFEPAITYTSAARSRSPKYREIMRALEQTPQRWRVVAAGDEIGGWRVLHPRRGDDFPRADDEAIVLSGEIQGKRVTLLSELGSVGQQALLAQTNDLRTDVLIAGVPNGGPVANPELLQAMRPQVFVLAGNDAKMQRALRDLRGRATNLVTTLEDRAVTMSAARGAVVLDTMGGRHIEIH
jgi:beta-lactamase superfamily II metal-dependent hydrolase